MQCVKATSLGLAMLLAFAAGSSHANAAPAADIEATVAVRSSLAADSPQTRHILDWIAATTPQFAPMAGPARLRVEQILQARDANTLQRLARDGNAPLPPNGLPETGTPGEIYKVESILPDGTTQHWEYRWESPSSGHGASWVFVAYSVRVGRDPVNVQ